MEITVFAKKRHTREGKVFFSYLTRLTKKDGETLTASVKFKEDGGPVVRPEDCPCNLIIEKAGCNFSSKTMMNQATGEIIVSNTLWVNAWRPGAAYEDHSMDDFI